MAPIEQAEREAEAAQLLVAQQMVALAILERRQRDDLGRAKRQLAKLEENFWLARRRVEMAHAEAAVENQVGVSASATDAATEDDLDAIFAAIVLSEAEWRGLHLLTTALDDFETLAKQPEIISSIADRLVAMGLVARAMTMDGNGVASPGHRLTRLGWGAVRRGSVYSPKGRGTGATHFIQPAAVVGSNEEAENSPSSVGADAPLQKARKPRGGG